MGKEYCATNATILAPNEDNDAENKLGYVETMMLVQEATRLMGTKSTAPETSLLIDSCESAKNWIHEVERKYQLTSFYDDAVDLIKGSAKKGQRIIVNRRYGIVHSNGALHLLGAEGER